MASYVDVAAKLAYKTSKRSAKKLLNLTMLDILTGTGLALLRAVMVGGYVMWGVGVAVWSLVSLGAGWWKELAPGAGDALLCWGIGIWVVLQVQLMWCLVGGVDDSNAWWVRAAHTMLSLPALVLEFLLTQAVPYVEAMYGGMSIEGMQLQAFLGVLPHAIIHTKAYLPAASLVHSWYLLSQTDLSLPHTPLSHILLTTYLAPFRLPITYLGTKLGALPAAYLCYYYHAWPMVLVPDHPHLILAAAAIGSAAALLHSLYTTLRIVQSF